MITLFSGIPGSGKTYLMVSNLDAVKDKYFVIHNIDGLKKDYLGQYGCDFREYCEREKMDVVDFLSKDFQIQFAEAVWEKYERRCLVIVDEAHEWFHRNRIALVMWLSYHRHINQTIWLVAHRSTNIPAVYRSYIELEYRAKSSSLIFLPMFFFYNRLSNGTAAGYTFARKRKKIFDLYKSQNDGFVKESPSLVIPIALGLCLLGAVFFATLPKRLFSANKQTVEAKNDVHKLKMVSADKSADVVNLRLAGRVGQLILFEDLNTRQILTIDDLPEMLILVDRPHSVILFDAKSEKNITVTFTGRLPLADETAFFGKKPVSSVVGK